jgi:serine/threonine protein kinase/tetratricopeptide (TPR) repeat protein
MLRPGDPFDRYTVEEMLGEGGMGRVYRALDTKLHRRVALKVLRIDKEGDPAHWRDAAARMMREARSAAALDHPNAVSIFDVGENDGTPFIAMELVPGRSLRAFVGDPQVTWQTKLRWLVDVGAALSAAHEAGLVHRDIKPENVIVRDDGRIKVLDFGIARRATSERGEKDDTHAQHGVGTLTGKGVIVGTLQYMPPEQLGARPIDGRADQFAWAVTAYELFAGATPWPANVDALATISAVLTQPAPPLGSLAPELPAEVVATVMRALAKAPEDRFPTMNDILAAIEPHAAPPVRNSSARPEASSQPGVQVSKSSRPGIPSSRTTVDPHAQTAAQRGPTDRGVAVDPPSASARPLPVRAGRWRWIGGAAALALVGAAAVALRPHVQPPVGAPGSAIAPPASGVTLLDLPRPATANPQALAAYLGGMTALRDGDLSSAERLFNDAVRLDAGIAGARLRVAIMQFYRGWVQARATFHKAVELRASLSPHDQALVDALQPAVEREPSDWSESERRLREATKRFPGDSDLHYNLSRLAMMQGQLRAADEAADSALADDPHMAAAYDAKIYAAQREGDPVRVGELYDACLKVAPQATQCLRRIIISHQWEGKCDAVESEARGWSRMDADSAEAYEYLAQGEFSNGKPIDLVRATLEQAWNKQSEDEREFDRTNDQSSLAIVLGDVAGTERTLALLAQNAAAHHERFYHMVPAFSLASLKLELGDGAGAAKVAGEFLRTQDAWAMDVGSDPTVISNDVLPYMLAVVLAGGGISREERAARRATWLAEWKARLQPSVVPNLWVYGYAFPAQTEADAREALDALAEYLPIPPFRPYNGGDSSVGHVYLLAGRIDEALPILRRAAAACDAIEEPFLFVQKKLWLGEAEEAKGNHDAACAAYKKVLGYWGHMPRSLTAATARTHAGALRCGG